MLTSLESLISPSNDPNNHIGLSYFKQKEKMLIEQKAQEAAVNFSISVAVVGGPNSGKNTLLSTECQEMNEYIKKAKIKGIGIQIYVRLIM
jgi:tRNA U34 5-carboxymethylaminomethyl modifying GTPase MnmE/TrmE